jgi:hypothetical protein
MEKDHLADAILQIREAMEMFEDGRINHPDCRTSAHYWLGRAIDEIKAVQSQQPR